MLPAKPLLPSRCPRLLLQIALALLVVAVLVCILALPIYILCRVRGWVGGVERTGRHIAHVSSVALLSHRFPP
jgi:hypothetical protein